MTVPTTASYAVLAWTGVETTYNCAFRAKSTSHVHARFTDNADVVTPLEQGTHYTVTRDPTTEVVTLLPIVMPAASGQIYVWRNTPPTQDVDFEDLEDFPAETHTYLHDLAAMRDAEQRRDLNFVSIGEGSEAGLLELQAAIDAAEAAADRAGQAADGVPIVLVGTGQSNFVHILARNWTPAPNVKRLNWDLVDGHVGSALVDLPSNTISIMDKYASDIGYANPTRPVYVATIAIGSQPIAQWLPSPPITTPPLPLVDMYANLKANVEAMLALIGVSTIDRFCWWQGENQTAKPYNYVADFNAVMTRLQAETWFPRSTPVIVCGIAPTSQSGLAQSDVQNAYLQAAVMSEPDTRRFVYLGIMDASRWADTLHPNAQGMFDGGALMANADLSGETHQPLVDPLSRVVRSQYSGRPANRNLIIGGDLSTNPWRFGTSFPACADGTEFAENWFYRKSGTGVATIRRTQDAPTMAQVRAAYGGLSYFTRHCIDWEVTASDTIANPEFYCIEHEIDARSAAFLGFGQAGASNLSVGFFAKGSLATMVSLTYQNAPRTRSFTRHYAFNAVDTWEFKALPISGDDTGVWEYDTGVGGRLIWTLAASNTYAFGNDLVWWPGDIRAFDPARGNLMSTVGNRFKLCLIQAEEGNTCSAFEQQPTRISSAPVITTDTGLSTNSDAALPTEKAARGYIDTTAGILNAYLARIGNFCAGYALNVNFNALGDTAIPIILPQGITKYRFANIVIFNNGATVSLTAAQFGVFTAAAGGGVAVVASGNALSAATSNAINTNQNTVFATLAVNALNVFNYATLYFRMTQVQGAAAAGNVYINVQPIP